MHFGPFHDQSKYARRQVAVPHLQRLDADDGAEFLVTHMEVGRVMVVEVHRDDDSQEAAYLGHGLSPCVWAFGFILPPCRKDKRRVVETDFPESGGGPSPRPSPRSRGEGDLTPSPQRGEGWGEGE